MTMQRLVFTLQYYQCFLYSISTFDELPFEEEILAFLRYFGHSGEIKKITDVNINKLHQPWRSFAAVINKCLSGKSTGYDGLRDDQMFTTIKLVSRHQNTQQFGAMLPVELANEDIRNSTAYKEYYAITSGEAPPKTKASVRKTQSSFDTTMPPPTAAGIRLSTSAKGKQPAKSSKAKEKMQQAHISQASGSGVEEGTGIIPGVLDVPTNESDEEISWKSSDKDDDDDIDDQSEADDDDDQDLDNDENYDDESHGMNVGGDEGLDSEDDDEELYRDININLEGRDVQMTDVHTTEVLEDSHVTLTPINPDGQQQSSSVSSQFVTSMPNPNPDTCIDSLFESTHRVDAPVSTTVVPLLDLLNFGSLFGFNHRLKTLEANFSEFRQTNQFVEAVSFIPGIVDRYIDHRMHEAVKVVVQLQSDRLREEAQAENEDFLKKLDENIQKIIKEQVKEKVKIILDTYGDIVMLKRHRDDDDKDEEPSAGSDRGSKRRRAGKEPQSTGAPKEKESKTSGQSTEGSKSYQKTASESVPAEEPMQTTQDLEEPLHQEFETGAADDQPVAEASQHPKWFQKQKKPLTPDYTLTPELLAGPTYELMKGSCKSLVELKFFLEEVYKAKTDQLDGNNPEGQQYPHNLLKPLPLITNSQGRRVIPSDHFINNDLEYLRGGASSRKYITSVTKTKEADYGHIKWIKYLVPRTIWSQAPVSYDKYALWGISHWGNKRQQFYGFTVNRESARDVYSKRRIIVVLELQIVEWHDYKHLDWFTGIRMKYLPQTIWRRSDKERAAAMIQAIDKQLKTRRIMRSLEKFIGGRLYEGDFRMLQRTI
nr:hypothetical protein [Tanacetum cinerariifolium]